MNSVHNEEAFTCVYGFISQSTINTLLTAIENQNVKENVLYIKLNTCNNIQWYQNGIMILTNATEEKKKIGNLLQT